MPDQIWINEPIAASREMEVRLVGGTNQGVSGCSVAAGTAILIAKPGTNLAADGAVTLTEITGGNDVGHYRLGLSADAVSVVGEGRIEITTGTGPTIQVLDGSYTVRPLDALYYGKIVGGGAGTTIDLDSATPGGSAPATDNFFANVATSRVCLVLVVGGTGKGQARLGTSYTAANRRLTIDTAFTTALDSSGGANTSIVKLLPATQGASGNVDNNAVAAAVWALARAGNQGAGTFGEILDAAISSRATVASLLTGALGGGRTVQGVLRRLDWWMTSKATGLRGTLAKFFQYDGVTTGFQAGQTTSTGARDAATGVSGD